VASFYIVLGLIFFAGWGLGWIIEGKAIRCKKETEKKKRIKLLKIGRLIAVISLLLAIALEVFAIQMFWFPVGLRELWVAVIITGIIGFIGWKKRRRRKVGSVEDAESKFYNSLAHFSWVLLIVAIVLLFVVGYTASFYHPRTSPDFAPM